eukprot:gnl/TRDRNA2_/TRDRNA2_180503_c0_seq1.p1 gnl/TRDRNA2_/TRDRNA2_180503_c0~~gnl/TRDRNA2_/TRDRNA2_180503_c0_seq1.p1  ORF type:complete len:237 (+),score=37.25 gnl/TRDRNA2_/TRDRNA2_180503_c0_seq1:130-840(+)
MGHQKDVGNCCFCIPLRNGVGMLALLHFIHAFVCIVNLFSPDTRLQSGGYNPNTDRLQCFSGALGIVFAIIGLLGVYDNKVGWIRVYNYFQWSKLLICVIVYICDMYELRKCESWAGMIQSQVAYNPALDFVAKNGLCSRVRLDYSIGWFLDVALFFYFAWVSNEYCSKMAMDPPYIISFAARDQSADHMNVRFFDQQIGEPSQYLEKTERPTALAGKTYGAMGSNAGSLHGGLFG